MIYNIDNMKYLFITILLSIFVISPSFAQTTNINTTTGTKSAIFEESTEVSLEKRKSDTYTNLQEISNWLNTVLLRVQLATNRLSANKINTSEALNQINLAQTNLNTARVELELFNNTPIDNKPETLIKLRTHAKNTEEALKNTRTHITSTLSTLQQTLLSQ